MNGSGAQCDQNASNVCMEILCNGSLHSVNFAYKHSEWPKNVTTKIEPRLCLKLQSTQF